MLLLLTMIGFANAEMAQASSFTCTNEKVGIFDETVILKTEGDTITITHYGHSRNTYSAVYAVQHSQGTRYGSTASLQKIHDNSTWKDMPEALELDHYVTDGMNEYILSGLTHAGILYAHFPAQDCVAGTQFSAMASAGPGCHHRNPECCGGGERPNICH